MIQSIHGELTLLPKLDSEFESAYCRMPGVRPQKNHPGLWETVPKMKWAEQIERFDLAAKLCLKCPCLKSCKDYANLAQKAGIAIDGVIAGINPMRAGTFICRGCKETFDGEANYRLYYCRPCYRKKEKS